MKSSKGFTLVELLVVISIITVLAAMLLPTLERALSQARAVVCLGQFKQVALISNMYADDNEDSFAPRSRLGYSIYPATYPVSNYASYGLSQASLTCPGVGAKNPLCGNYMYVAGAFINVSSSLKGKIGVCDMRRNNLDQASRWAISLDIQLPDTGVLGSLSQPVTDTISGISYRFIQNHQVGLNMALADGSAKWFGGSEIKSAGTVWSAGQGFYLCMWPKAVPMHIYCMAGFANPNYYWQDKDGKGYPIISEYDNARIARNFGARSSSN